MMYNIRVFEYTRGSLFSCKVIINEFQGVLCFDDVVVPNNTPQKVKEMFLEEAEVAALKIIEGKDGTLYRGE